MMIIENQFNLKIIAGDLFIITIKGEKNMGKNKSSY